MTVLTLATMIVAALTASLLASYWPGHTPAAVALSALAALELLALAPIPPGVEAARALALYAVPAALGMDVVATMGPRAAPNPGLAIWSKFRFLALAAVVVAWGATTLVLEVVRPPLPRACLVALLVSLAASGAALAVYVRRTLAARKVIGSSGAVALMLVALELWTLAVPAGASRFASWPSSSPSDTLVMIGPLFVSAVIVAAQVIILWTLPSSPSSP